MDRRRVSGPHVARAPDSKHPGHDAIQCEVRELRDHALMADQPSIRFPRLRRWLAQMRRPTIFPVVAGLILGPILGYILFSLTDLEGKWRFVCATTLATFVVGLV